MVYQVERTQQDGTEQLRRAKVKGQRQQTTLLHPIKSLEEISNNFDVYLIWGKTDKVPNRLWTLASFGKDEKGAFVHSSGTNAQMRLTGPELVKLLREKRIELYRFDDTAAKLAWLLQSSIPQSQHADLVASLQNKSPLDLATYRNKAQPDYTIGDLSSTRKALEVFIAVTADAVIRLQLGKFSKLDVFKGLLLLDRLNQQLDLGLPQTFDSMETVGVSEEEDKWLQESLQQPVTKVKAIKQLSGFKPRAFLSFPDAKQFLLDQAAATGNTTPPPTAASAILCEVAPRTPAKRLKLAASAVDAPVMRLLARSYGGKEQLEKLIQQRADDAQQQPCIAIKLCNSQAAIDRLLQDLQSGNSAAAAAAAAIQH